MVVLPQCRPLAHLNLSGNSIGADGAESFCSGAGAMLVPGSFESLAATRSGLRGRGGREGVLGAMLYPSHLNLGHNSIEDDGRGIRGCWGNVSLAHLDLSGNLIGDAGAGSLAQVLPQCTSLAHLNLGHGTSIGDAGAGSFSCGEKQRRGHNKSLTCLNLGQPIGDAGRRGALRRCYRNARRLLI